MGCAASLLPCRLRTGSIATRRRSRAARSCPRKCDEAAALTLLRRHPLLIRRPLLEVDGVRRVGFDVAAIDAWIGLGTDLPGEDMEACQHGKDGHVCQGHDHDHDHDGHGRDCGC